MELKNLNTFVQVAELGSFSRAAERLGYAQPTISVQIKQLEEELGLRLFDRIGRKHTMNVVNLLFALAKVFGCASDRRPASHVVKNLHGYSHLRV